MDCSADTQSINGGMILSTTATIFIVDDDPAVQQSLRMLFRSVGYRTEVFNHAQQFLDAYNDQLTGCIVLDMRMPGMSGLELQLQLSQRQSILPVIFMTGHGD